jgi:hypothetical protein
MAPPTEMITIWAGCTADIAPIIRMVQSTAKATDASIRIRLDIMAGSPVVALARDAHAECRVPCLRCVARAVTAITQCRERHGMPRQGGQDGPRGQRDVKGCAQS